MMVAEKEKGWLFDSHPRLTVVLQLSLLDSAHRANACTSTAVSAKVGIDLVDVTG